MQYKICNLQLIKNFMHFFNKYNVYSNVSKKNLKKGEKIIIIIYFIIQLIYFYKLFINNKNTVMR